MDDVKKALNVEGCLNAKGFLRRLKQEGIPDSNLRVNNWKLERPVIMIEKGLNTKRVIRFSDYDFNQAIRFYKDGKTVYTYDSYTTTIRKKNREIKDLKMKLDRQDKIIQTLKGDE